MIINGFDVDIKVENKNRKYTLLSIPGMNSDMEFISSLDKTPNGFNHIKISLPKEGNLSVDDMSGIVKTIIDEHITTSHLVLLGHSLGAVHALNNADNPKVKKVIFVSPLNPSILTPRKKQILESTLGSGKVVSAVDKWFMKHNNAGDGILRSVFDPKRPYREIFTNDVLNDEFMSKLDEKYKANTKKSLFIIGHLDIFVDPRELQIWLKTFGQKLHIVKGGHNPFRYDPKTMKKLINEFIPAKVRIIKKEIWKDS